MLLEQTVETTSGRTTGLPYVIKQVGPSGRTALITGHLPDAKTVESLCFVLGGFTPAADKHGAVPATCAVPLRRTIVADFVKDACFNRWLQYF